MRLHLKQSVIGMATIFYVSESFTDTTSICYPSTDALVCSHDPLHGIAIEVSTLLGQYSTGLASERDVV